MSHDQPGHASELSIWPATLALGVSLMCFGIVVGVAFSAAGLIVTLFGLAGWIAELRHG